MTQITIHYRSPKGDPFKVPRPHRVSIDDATGVASAPWGGEIGPVRQLIGFTKILDLRFNRGVDWWNAEDLYDGEVKDVDLAGWYACYEGLEGPFTATPKVERIEVTA